MRDRKFSDDGLAFVGLPPGAFSKPAEQIQTRIIPRHQINHERQIFVKSNYKPYFDGGNVVAYTERNAAHPGGEAFVSGNEPTLVALTEQTVAALNDGKITECSEIEISTYTTIKLSKTRKEIEKQREVHLQKYVELVGSSDGFDTAWESMRARLSLAAVADI